MHILGPAGVSPAGSQQSPGRFSATKPRSKAKGRSERQGTAGRGKSVPLKVLKNLNHVKIKCFITYFFCQEGNCPAHNQKAAGSQRGARCWWPFLPLETLGAGE